MGKSKKAQWKLLIVISLSMLSACATTHTKSAEKSPLTVVEQYLAALNRRDLLMLTAYVAPDVMWYSMVNGERIPEVSGRTALAETLRSYFAQNARTQWRIEQATVVKHTVAVRERSQWTSDQGDGERISLAVYEIRDGRIVRISYFLDTP